MVGHVIPRRSSPRQTFDRGYGMVGGAVRESTKWNFVLPKTDKVELCPTEACAKKGPAANAARQPYR